MAFFDQVYCALVSLETRGTPLAAQLDFLERFVLAGRGDIALLDLCCGHGRHLAGLGKAGRTLSGIDSNAAFIEMARAELGAGVQLRLADVAACAFGRGFNVILCLENSFAFDDAAAPRIMKKIGAALAEGGVAVVHLTNPAHLARLPRRSWHGVDGEWFILEEREFTARGCIVRHIRFRNAGGDGYEMDRVEVELVLRGVDALTALAGRCGLRPIRCFGSFVGEPWREDSKDIICLIGR